MCKKNKKVRIKKNGFFKQIKNFISRYPFRFVSLVYYVIASILILAYGGWFWLLALPVALTIVHFIYFFITDRLFFRNLKDFNLLIFGYRRSGKDLSTQKFIAMRYGRKYKKICKKMKFKSLLEEEIYFEDNPLYLTLYNYGYGGKVVSINEFELLNKETGQHVSYKEFIEGATILCDKKTQYEGLDFFLGEAHLSLPNTEHNTLDKVYKWLPVFISLSGHLYNMNVIINSQEFGRSWVKIRNQQDRYVKTLKTFPRGRSWIARNRRFFPFINKNIYTRLRIYEEYQSADNNVLPFKGASITTEATKPLYLTAGQATKEQYNAMNGRIIDIWIKTPLEVIKYDSRFFHVRIFNDKAPTN